MVGVIDTHVKRVVGAHGESPGHARFAARVVGGLGEASVEYFAGGLVEHGEDALARGDEDAAARDGDTLGGLEAFANAVEDFAVAQVRVETQDAALLVLRREDVAAGAVQGDARKPRVVGALRVARGDPRAGATSRRLKRRPVQLHELGRARATHDDATTVSSTATALAGVALQVPTRVAHHTTRRARVHSLAGGQLREDTLQQIQPESFETKNRRRAHLRRTRASLARVARGHLEIWRRGHAA